MELFEKSLSHHILIPFSFYLTEMRFYDIDCIRLYRYCFLTVILEFSRNSGSTSNIFTIIMEIWVFVIYSSSEGNG